MSRKKNWVTEGFCDVQIRKNTISTSNGVIRYRYGRYYVRTSVVGLRMPNHAVLNNPDTYEATIIRTLLHEINHWASYLYMDRADWYSASRGWKGIPHDDRLIEQIANWPLDKEAT